MSNFCKSAQKYKNKFLSTKRYSFSNYLYVYNPYYEVQSSEKQPWKISGIIINFCCVLPYLHHLKDEPKYQLFSIYFLQNCLILFWPISHKVSNNCVLQLLTNCCIHKISSVQMHILLRKIETANHTFMFTLMPIIVLGPPKICQPIKKCLLFFPLEFCFMKA